MLASSCGAASGLHLRLLVRSSDDCFLPTAAGAARTTGLQAMASSTLVAVSWMLVDVGFCGCCWGSPGCSWALVALVALVAAANC